ncbi:hypothetical protein B0H11DRAFT_2235686 [Mycena galericulata]|nr:hypothetical protein B0H11DRAFT_2235686 [Mycena galericulata]
MPPTVHVTIHFPFTSPYFLEISRPPFVPVFLPRIPYDFTLLAMRRRTSRPKPRALEEPVAASATDSGLAVAPPAGQCSRR